MTGAMFMNPEFRSMLMAMHALEPKEKPVSISTQVTNDEAQKLLDSFFPNQVEFTREQVLGCLRLCYTNGYVAGLGFVQNEICDRFRADVGKL
jgi:hypothetical protein